MESIIVVLLEFRRMSDHTGELAGISVFLMTQFLSNSHSRS